MRYFLDTEFNGFGGDLISLALVREDGEALYLATDCPSPCEWVRLHVLPVLSTGATPRLVAPNGFAGPIASFLRGDGAAEIVADWPDDIALFCRALIVGPGRMVNVGEVGFRLVRAQPGPARDTPAGAVRHNAFWDAMALRQAVLAAEG